MCGKSENAIRDREFDSAVRADIERAEAPQVSQSESQAVNYVGKVNCAELHRQAAARVAGLPNDDTPIADASGEAGPFVISDDEANETGQAQQAGPFDGARDALRDVLSAPTLEHARELANGYVDKVFAGYYLGRGQFDHVRFLSDLEQSKGAPLDAGELRFFGRIVGNYTGTRAANEAKAAAERGDVAEFKAIFESALS